MSNELKEYEVGKITSDFDLSQVEIKLPNYLRSQGLYVTEAWFREDEEYPNSYTLMVKGETQAERDVRLGKEIFGSRRSAGIIAAIVESLLHEGFSVGVSMSDIGVRFRVEKEAIINDISISNLVLASANFNISDRVHEMITERFQVAKRCKAIKQSGE